MMAKTRQTNQQNKESRNRPHKYSQLIFDKEAKPIHPHKKKKKKKRNLDTELTTFIKINSEWITDLNIKLKTTKLLEDNRRKPR